MSSERVHRSIRREKSSNMCSIIGFLLTLLNIAVSIILLVTKNGMTLLIFASITALVSLTLCIVGVSNANKVGKGKGISIFGIIVNVLILLAVGVFIIFIVLFAQACSGIFEGIFSR